MTRTSRVNGPRGVQINIVLSRETQRRVDGSGYSNQTGLAAFLTKHLTTVPTGFIIIVRVVLAACAFAGLVPTVVIFNRRGARETPKQLKKTKTKPLNQRERRRQEAKTKAFLMKTMDNTHVRLVKNLVTS
ncbi:hypothetical protein PR002_g20914 [Phytophthora rubi]|uniref:Uncharacterized protein n=1 Tax=Phytophthora rubi TaxID=129364 RepID=A0A6A3JFL1_9STRA|nr:hypothetical protein PR002_g20914 [Phytophthora rubi]